MRVKRSVLEQMVKEELAAHLHEMLSEGPKDETDVVDAEKEGQGKEKSKDQKPAKPEKDAKAPAQPGEEPEDLPVEDDPDADPELEKDVADPAGEEDAEEDAEEVTGGKIADEIQGKTIQSITMEPKSKTLPGAQEITLTFREIPDPLKILVTKQGQVKFFFKGLHNEV